LIAAAASPDARVRDLAERTDLSERGVLRILADLEASGFLERVRVGRCTRYEIDSRRGLDDRVGKPIKVGEFVALARGGRR
jgi:DNA-binding Lrp family transcriptional regulator